MTLAEFKAWFDGYTESMDGPPSEKQWERIKAKVRGVDDIRARQMDAFRAATAGKTALPAGFGPIGSYDDGLAVRAIEVDA